MLSDSLHWKARNQLLTTSDVQVTYTLYASFNFLLVSRAFGNPNLTSESWHYRETVASVCRDMSFSLLILLVWLHANLTELKTVNQIHPTS